MKRYSPTPPNQRSTLSSEWQHLATRLPSKELRYRLSRLIGYSNARGIRPEVVDDGIAEDFLRWLRDETFVKLPEVLYRKTLIAWNKAIDRVPDLPRKRLTVPSNRSTYAVPWDELPIHFRQDAEDWLDHLTHADPFAVDPFSNAPNIACGPLKPARPATLKSRRFQIRQLVGALRCQGHDVSRFRSLSDLIDLGTAKDALRFFYERNGKTTSSQVFGLASTLCAIAKYWCRVEPAQVEALLRIKSNLVHHCPGLTVRNRERLRQFTDPHRLMNFLVLPKTIRDRVRRHKPPNLNDARDMQIALAIELLLMGPIRRANLVTLRLGPGGHIRLPINDQREPVFIVIPANEVKNDVDLEFALPKETARLLRTYIQDYRPLLSDEPGPWLFPSKKPGTHKSLDQFSRHFTKTILRLTGLKINLHLMRHLGAKMYLDENPGAYETVRRVLGHKSLSTTVSNYTGLETDAALRNFDKVILGIRESLRLEIGDGV